MYTNSNNFGNHEVDPKGRCKIANLITKEIKLGKGC
jgi:hypothetical protein